MSQGPGITRYWLKVKNRTFREENRLEFKAQRSW
jgi:hypothetical protein